jgi:hypothetical protein
MIVNTAREAVIGGTISVVGGGKFSNGAQFMSIPYQIPKGIIRVNYKVFHSISSSKSSIVGHRRGRLGICLMRVCVMVECLMILKIITSLKTNKY